MVVHERAPGHGTDHPHPPCGWWPELVTRRTVSGRRKRRARAPWWQLRWVAALVKALVWFWIIDET
jgi:hypothetical protein